MVALNSDFAASKPETDTKNRVGRFFSLAAETVGADSRSSRNCTVEKRVYRYDIASVGTAFEYGPFGELIRATGVKSEMFNFRFSTKYTDAETGLLYYGYRYYDAEMGRWLNRDPIEEVGGLNLYGMVGNNPIMYVDPNGEIAFLAVVGIAWAVAEAVFAVYDTYDLISTLSDPCASTSEKIITMAGWGLGFVLPGGGYGTAGKKVAQELTERASRETAEATCRATRETTERTVRETTEEAAKKGGPSAKYRVLKEKYTAYKDGGGQMSITQWAKHTRSQKWGIGNVKSGFGKWYRGHGNVAGNQPATLYAKFRNGVFQKWGITHHNVPSRRYSNLGIGDVVKPLRRGPRSQMLMRERRLTERFPGPENFDRWAGVKNPSHPNYQGGP